MKAIISVSELNKNGLFISEIDTDNCYVSKGNPKGNFVLVVEPMEHGGKDNCILYQNKDGQLYIEGEAYLIEGNPAFIKRKVDAWIANYDSHRQIRRLGEVEFIEAELDI